MLKNLKIFDLSNNMLYNDGIKTLGEILYESSMKIKALIISNNFFDDIGLSEFFKMLSKSKSQI